MLLLMLMLMLLVCWLLVADMFVYWYVAGLVSDVAV